MNEKKVDKFHLGYPNLWPQQLVYYKVWLSCSSMSI